MAGIKKWNGSAWVDAPVKKWNGSAWVDAKIMKWTGSAWSQIYPDTVVTKTQTLSSTALNTYRSNWDNDSVAKQGVYSSYAAAHGYLGISAANLTGSGNITSISSAKFSGTRDGSGSYNNNQTVRFYRSNVNSTSVSPVNTVTGQFTSTTGGPGSGGAMTNRTITVNSETLNWANKVSSKPYLYIYSNASADYAGIKTSFSITLNYTYAAKMVTFADDGVTILNMTPYMYKSLTGKQPYHSIVIYTEEEGMTLQEIITRRENGVVEPIDASCIIDVAEIKPWTREYSIVDNTIKVEVFNMQWNDETQYSLDEEEWFTLYGESQESNYLTAKLPKDFNKYKDFVHIRIIDKSKETIHLQFSIDPIIYIPNQTSGIILPGEELNLNDIIK